MGKRFITAILTIFITSLKFVVNMITIGISFITKKDIPLVGMEALHNMSIPHTHNEEERSIYVVEHNDALHSNENTHVEWSEHNPRINVKRDLLD